MLAPSGRGEEALPEKRTHSSAKNTYLLDVRRMNGTDQHSLALQQGDRLQIRFETEKGTLTMAITGPDGTELYSGNGREATDFRLNIPESGVYTITVQAQRAKGIIQIQNIGTT